MKNVDIKQLALFCELIESQSLTEAAYRMNITPSAASQALTRLRNVLNDDLCVREKNRYQLTPYADGAYGVFQQMVDLWKDVSNNAWVFNPLDCDSHIIMSCYDAFGETELAELYRSITRKAPKLGLDIHAPANGPADVVALRDGAVDVVCSHYEPPADARDLYRETVKHFHITHCCVSVDHPRIRDTLTLAQYQAEEHLLITFLKRHGGRRSPIDLELELRGFPPRKTTIVNSWHLCSELLARTDRLVTTSRQQAWQLERSNPRIRSVPLPTDFEWPTMPVNMIWHQRTHNSKPHRWLRLQLREFLSAVAEEPLPGNTAQTPPGAAGQGAR